MTRPGIEPRYPGPLANNLKNYYKNRILEVVKEYDYSRLIIKLEKDPENEIEMFYNEVFGKI